MCLSANIKDGGTKDRNSDELRIILAGRFTEALNKFSNDSILHFESGMINFTVNSIYEDDSKEYYGIYPDEIRADEQGDVWIKVR